ncbi:MAG: GNAT family N-acetyltransferase [Clostridia bacterium]|nr:GNAT family N-acetyltransferase [Clostridia bacterium]
MVELREVTKENLEEILNLNVLEHQKAFVSSTATSLAQAYVYRKTAFPFAIYVDNTIVGFIMLGYYEDRKQYTLWKLLIDKNHQNKGYGKEALRQGIKYLKDNFEVNEIYTGVALGNEKAKHLYSSVGFEETGLVENNMEEMKCVL